MLSEGIISAKLLFNNLSKKINIQGAGQNEINSIIYLVLENIFRLSRMDVVLDKKVQLTQGHILAINEIIGKLNADFPLQYILGETEFYGLKFKVTPAVLIPRPETEELVDLILKENLLPGLRVLDIGTGSGCIAITLGKYLIRAEVYALDKEKAALDIATENAKINEVEINFWYLDILSKMPAGKKFDIIVSNPPYVLNEEKKQMKNNVLLFEPASALFVPDEDPLIFYKRIIKITDKLLGPGGKLYFEINERFGLELKMLMLKNHFVQVDLITDMQNKNRILKGIKA